MTNSGTQRGTITLQVGWDGHGAEGEWEMGKETLRGFHLFPYLPLGC